MLSKIQSVVYFVDDPARVSTWYEQWLPVAPFRSEADFVGFHLDGIDLCFHKADAKAIGKGQQVTYWRVSDLYSVSKSLQRLGATVYRESTSIEDGARIMQICDPFGNILGFYEAA